MEVVMKPNVRYYKILAIIRLSKDSQQRIYRGAIISSKVELSRAYLRSNPGRELLMVRFLLKFDGPSWDVDREKRGWTSLVVRFDDDLRSKIGDWFNKKAKNISETRLVADPIEVEMDLENTYIHA